MSVVTRFAPSPTGFLHIGGARTALFNWLYARGRGGKFLLRVEDTDKARSTPEATQAILDGLAWFGLDWDEDAIFQSARADRHVAVAEDLLSKGAAFRCYATQDELDALREQARAEGRALRSPWRNGDTKPPADAPFVVRLRAPDDNLTINDAVQGEVTVKSKDLDDLILLRSDGSPTYMLAVVVDDHDMGVTHVIRGDDHLTNAFRQAPIYAAMGWPTPTYAHIPMIHGADGAKLSKRHGALGVGDYADQGFLPEALRNYLLRLGWSHGDEEIISDAQAMQWFDFGGVGKAPSKLDLEKLASVNAHYLKQADNSRLLDLLKSRAKATSTPFTKEAESRILDAMEVLKTRASTLPELLEQTAFLSVSRPIELTPKAAKALNDDAKARLSRLAAMLKAAPDWTPDTLSQLLQGFAAEEAVGFGRIGGPLRAALTGGKPSPDIGLVLTWLGPEETLLRLSDQAG